MSAEEEEGVEGINRANSVVDVPPPAQEVPPTPQPTPTSSPAIVTVCRPRNLGLILDVKTRWNSTYAMLKRLVELRAAVEMFVSTDEKLKKLSLSVEEWDMVRHIVDILKPLYLATLHLSKSKYPSLASTLPTYAALIRVRNLLSA